ncbi:unnamed protein product [Owenia fusiformis]|uniref:Uncharacterized protein n=1 Tax=Owenia fusiformis TaxID=6347 RepID=A0A8S4N771_OWEFU|nr:unnamed protein product [Owenia fusiformis]
MNTRQLQQIMNSDTCLRQHTHAVYASDEIPERVVQRPAFFIVNTQASSLRGQHWCAFSFFNKTEPAEFFDSMGQSPEYYNQAFLNVLVDNSKHFIYNNTRIQGKDLTCGQHCAYYLNKRCRDNTMRCIVNSFSKYNLKENDVYVKEFVNRMYGNVVNEFY